MRYSTKLRYCVAFALILSAHSICSEIETAGYQIIVARDEISCISNDGVWLVDCCFSCESNRFASGAVVLEDGTVFSNLYSAFFATNFFWMPDHHLIFRILPGVYLGLYNCNINVQGSSSQMIGVCGPLYTSINCNNSMSHLRITSTRAFFELNGLTLINGYNGENGGCVSINGPGAVISLVDSNLLHCVSDKSGGAISMYNLDLSYPSTSTVISIKGKSRIENCSAKLNGGALYLEVGSTEHSIQILLAGDTAITGNEADYNGGAIAIDIISGDYQCLAFSMEGLTTLSRNKAGSSGGGIWIDTGISNIDSISLSQYSSSCPPQGDSVCSPPAPGRPIAIFGNQASDGGAVYVTAARSKAPDVRIIGLALSNNFASGKNSGFGNGGAVLVRGARLAVLCSYLSWNRARADGGSCWLSLGGLSISSSSLSNSSAGASGGALLIEDSPSTVTMALSTFVSNIASNGGAISLRNCSGAVLLSGLILDRNTALQGSGGALSVLHASGALKLVLCTLSNNRAWIDGSALYLSTVLEAAQDPKFTPSWVQSDYVEPDLENGNAALYVIQNCSILSNIAVNGNGAIALSGKAMMGLDATTFVKNQAQSGGAFYCKQNSSANLSLVSFQSNFGNNFGGAVHVQDNCAFGLESSEFFSNSAGICGGALSLNSTNPVTAGGYVHITLNSAERSGGGVCILVRNNIQSPLCHSRTSEYPIMFSLQQNADVLIELNSAKGQGGAIFYSCIQPGSAAIQIWSSQNLTLSTLSYSRRELHNIDSSSRKKKSESRSFVLFGGKVQASEGNVLGESLRDSLRSMSEGGTNESSGSSGSNSSSAASGADTNSSIAYSSTLSINSTPTNDSSSESLLVFGPNNTSEINFVAGESLRDSLSSTSEGGTTNGSSRSSGSSSSSAASGADTSSSVADSSAISINSTPTTDSSSESDSVSAVITGSSGSSSSSSVTTSTSSSGDTGTSSSSSSEITSISNGSATIETNGSGTSSSENTATSGTSSSDSSFSSGSGIIGISGSSISGYTSGSGDSSGYFSSDSYFGSGSGSGSGINPGCPSCSPEQYILKYVDLFATSDVYSGCSRAPVCQTCSNSCSPGQYISRQCDGTGFSDVICTRCTSSCAHGQYKSGSCDRGNTFSDLLCIPCKSSCPSGFYLDGACDGSHRQDSIVCKSCSICPPGTFTKSICDGTSRSDVVSCSSSGSEQTVTVQAVKTCMDFAQPQVIGQSIGTFETGGDVYGPNYDCYWLLNPPTGTKLELTFTSFLTEANADYVELFSCKSAVSTGNCMQSNARLRIASKLSGSSKPSKLMLDLNDNGLLVHFQSDASICFAGFKASFCIPGISCASSSSAIITFALRNLNASITFLENTAGLYGDFMATDAEAFELYGNEDHSYVPGESVKNSVRVRDSFNQTVLFFADQQPSVAVQVGYNYQKQGINGSIWAPLDSGAQYTPGDNGIWNFSRVSPGAAAASVLWYFTKSEGFVDVRQQSDSTGIRSMGQVIIHNLIPSGTTNGIGGIDCSQGDVCKLKRQLSRLDCSSNQTFKLSGSGFTNAWTTAMTGMCTDCTTGKYVIKINGVSVDDIDSCQTCPDGAVCENGNLTWFVDNVDFSIRKILVMDRYPALANRLELDVWQYQILGCPPGHSLKNSSAGTSYGAFSHDRQICQPCQRSEYIVDQREKCQTCPSGASCDGSSGVLLGDEGSFWRREGDRMRVYKCLPGYVLIRDDSDDVARALFDSCQKCLPLKYSASGAQVYGLEPCTLLRTGESPYRCPALESRHVVGYSDIEVNGTWALSPELAQGKCLDCPSGANCTGGDAVIPLEGFWKPNVSALSSQVVATRRIDAGNISGSRKETPVELYVCPPSACEGGGSCAEGREGPVCGLCKPGYAMSSGRCDICPSDTKNSKIAFAIVAPILAIVLLYFFSFQPVLGHDEPPEELGNEDLQDRLVEAGEYATKCATGGHDEDEFKESCPEMDETILGKQASELKKDLELDNFKQISNVSDKVKLTLPIKSIFHLYLQIKEWAESKSDLESFKNFVLGYAKVIISFYQVLSTFVGNYKITWPIRVVGMFQYAAIFRFDMISFPGPNCVAAEFTYIERLLIYTILPGVVVLLLCIAPMFSMIVLISKTGESKKKYRRVFEAVLDQFWYSLLFCLFLFYPTVSVATLRTFNCQDLGIEGIRLMADYREPCPYDSSNVMGSQNFIFAWAAFCTLVYPIGVPIFFFAVMRIYKIPQIAEHKLNAAKVDALVIAYKKAATPVEAEILIRQLRISSVVLQDGQILDNRINLLFDALALHGAQGKSESLSLANFRNFFVANTSLLGLPNPNSEVLKDLIKSKDTSGDGAIDRKEFTEMMHQMVTIQNLFTGHETLGDMHYEQLSRLYEYHKTGEIYLENAIKSKQDGEVESLQQKIIKEIIKRISRSRVKPAPATAPKVEELLKRIAEHGRDAVQYTEYRGAAEMMRLTKQPRISRDCLEALQLAMVPDLRRRILILANEKALDGTIAIPIVLWSDGSTPYEASEGNQASLARKAAEEEQRVIKRIGFLTKNYKVQFWYFELLEMIRKLLMTSIVTFIYTGTPAQITAALVITLAFGLYTQRTRPFADDKIGDMQIFSLVVQAFTLIYGLMLVIDELTTLLGLRQSFTQEAVRNTLGAFVVFLNTAVVAFPWLQAVMNRLHTHVEGRRRAKAVIATDQSATVSQTTKAGQGREASKWNNSVLDVILKTSIESVQIHTGPAQVDPGYSDSESWCQAAGVHSQHKNSHQELDQSKSEVEFAQPALRVDSDACLDASQNGITAVLPMNDEHQHSDASFISSYSVGTTALQPAWAGAAEQAAKGAVQTETREAGCQSESSARMPWSAWSGEDKNGSIGSEGLPIGADRACDCQIVDAEELG